MLIIEKTASFKQPCTIEKLFTPHLDRDIN